MTPRRTLLTVAAAGLLLGGLAPLAGADSVSVTLAVPDEGQREVHVEDLAGNPLTGSEADGLAFGTSREKPFRVRVVDPSIPLDAAPLQVDAELTNLYRQLEGGNLDYDVAIPSGNVALGYATVPLDLDDVRTLVSPVFDVTGTVVDDICAELELLGLGTCDRTQLDGLEGLFNEVALPIDLGDLTNLPLIPQAGETGAFTNPSFAGVGTDDPDADGADPATRHTVIEGTSPLLGEDPAAIDTVLDGIESELAGLAGDPAADFIDRDVLSSALADMVGGQTTLDTVLASLGITLDDAVDALVIDAVGDLAVEDVLRLYGTYFSFPVLDVDTGGAAPGTYEGTLVVDVVQ